MKEIVKLINTFIIKYYNGQGHRLWKKNKNCKLASSHGSCVIIVSSNIMRMRVKADNPWEAVYWSHSCLPKFLTEVRQGRKELG